MRYFPAALFLCGAAFPALADPLPSWNDGPARSAIIDFIEQVTDPESKDFVPREDRIAAFDNDGTLWSEQPVYFQALYALDVLKEKAAADPLILGSETLQAASAGDIETVLAGGEGAIMELVGVAHADISVDDFQADVRDWAATGRHPASGLTYAGMTYQPMVELLRYLRDEGFATYIVSGGGVHFIRAIAEDAYGIPPQQVVGSEGETRYEEVDGRMVLMKRGGLGFYNDNEAKPVGIDRHIGRRPIFVAGNSDGDFQMLEYATSGDRPGLALIVHHTDAEREFAYDREGHVGVLNRGLDEAQDRGWLLVDMARDWNRVWTGTD